MAKAIFQSIELKFRIRDFMLTTKSIYLQLHVLNLLS